MTKKDAPGPKIDAEFAREILKDYPPTPSDIMNMVMAVYEEKNLPPSNEGMRVVLNEWLKTQPKAEQIFNGFKVSTKAFKITSSTISLWYRQAVGMEFQAFAESNHDYWTLVHWKDDTWSVQSVEKNHTG